LHASLYVYLQKQTQQPKNIQPPNDKIVARNDTPRKENLGFGTCSHEVLFLYRVENFYPGFFLDPEKPPTTILLFEPVGYATIFFSHHLALLQPTLHSPASAAQVQFDTPILRAYITSEYQEGSIIRTPVISPVLFSEDLSQLDEETTWKITHNAGSGVFKITQEKRTDEEPQSDI
jgi:hypothetical protein